MAIALALQSGGAGKVAAARRHASACWSRMHLPIGLPALRSQGYVRGHVCYIAYTAVDWPGIHTCVITCAIVAR
jgi:hypothetical protein